MKNEVSAVIHLELKGDGSFTWSYDGMPIDLANMLHQVAVVDPQFKAALFLSAAALSGKEGSIKLLELNKKMAWFYINQTAD